MEQTEEQTIQQGENTAYISKQPYNQEAMMSQHLDSSAMLTQLKNMLMGLEYDDEEDEWIPSMMVVGYNEKGEEMRVAEGPLMEPKDVRITIGYLQMFLNPNTYLSQLDQDRINDIMWDVSKKLGVMFYNLRHKINSGTRDMIWGMIEYPILLGLSRANKKITLDALTKMQHSIEHIQAGQGKQPQELKPPKEFKLFG